MERRLLADDLYQYLLSLASALGTKDQDAAEQVLNVSRFASGSTSELLGEARLLLPKILSKNASNLSELDRARLRETIAAIELEFNRVGGG